MNTYYLQTLESGRLIIDTKIHKFAVMEKSVRAGSWIKAKMDFGFPLTSRQYAML